MDTLPHELLLHIFNLSGLRPSQWAPVCEAFRNVLSIERNRRSKKIGEKLLRVLQSRPSSNWRGELWNIYADICDSASIQSIRFVPIQQTWSGNPFVTWKPVIDRMPPVQGPMEYQEVRSWWGSECASLESSDETFDELDLRELAWVGTASIWDVAFWMDAEEIRSRRGCVDFPRVSALTRLGVQSFGPVPPDDLVLSWVREIGLFRPKDSWMGHDSTYVAMKLSRQLSCAGFRAKSSDLFPVAKIRRTWTSAGVDLATSLDLLERVVEGSFPTGDETPVWEWFRELKKNSGDRRFLEVLAKGPRFKTLVTRTMSKPAVAKQELKRRLQETTFPEGLTEVVRKSLGVCAILGFVLTCAKQSGQAKLTAMLHGTGSR